MITIQRGAINTIDLTLTELVTLANPYFLFVFTNKLTNEVTKCLLSNISAETERYDRFEINEPDDAELIPGDYKYQVYEKAVSNLTIPDTGLLETGIARVGLTPLSETEYESDLATDPQVYEST